MHCWKSQWCSEESHWQDSSWKELPSVLKSIRTAKHTTLGVSPYHSLFGRDARTPVTALRQTTSLWTKTSSPTCKSSTRRWLTWRIRPSKPVSQGSCGRSTGCEWPGTLHATYWWWWPGEGPYKVLEVLGPLTYPIDISLHFMEGRVHRNALKRFVSYV